ncbi:MAG: hypothetical protein AAFU71_06550 [Cyanobacteria bacterium J06632_22]
MFTAKPFRPFRHISVGTITLTLLLGGMLAQGVKASLGPLEPGGYGWLPLELQPGRYTVRASTFGDVDIVLFNAERTEPFNLFVEEAGGYDTISFAVDTAEVRYVRYSMVSCYNLRGSCSVDIVVDGPA